MSFDVALAEEIWTAKYRFRTDRGDGDSSFAETAQRVAQAVAAAEAPDQQIRLQRQKTVQRSPNGVVIVD